MQRLARPGVPFETYIWSTMSYKGGLALEILSLVLVLVGHWTLVTELPNVLFAMASTGSRSA